MIINNRRDFLRVVGGTVGLSILPSSILKALSIEANNKTGTIEDVEHIVILTQENRSFDHYFGTMYGVRGFSDRLAIPIADTLKHKKRIYGLKLTIQIKIIPKSFLHFVLIRCKNSII